MTASVLGSAIATAAIIVMAMSSSVVAQCQGSCQDTGNYCPSSYQPGLCPGPSNIECCPEATNCPGQCQDNSLQCSGNYVAGLCPGPDNVQCCEAVQPGSGCGGFADSQWNCADPGCSSTVPEGSPQPNYECAEFVSRSLASGGYISLGATDPQGSYANYNYNGQTYDLLWTSSHSAEGGPLGLEDLLQAMGWSTGGGVSDCTVLLVEGSGGYETHVAVGIASGLIDAHNNARYHVDSGYYSVDNIYNPPGNWAKQNVTRPAPVRRYAPQPVVSHLYTASN